MSPGSYQNFNPYGQNSVVQPAQGSEKERDEAALPPAPSGIIIGQETSQTQKHNYRVLFTDTGSRLECFIREDVFRAIVLQAHHAAPCSETNQDNRFEAGGLLYGQIQHIAGHKTTIYLDECIATQDRSATVVSFQITKEELARAGCEIIRRHVNGAYVLVATYHSHPGHGVFHSEADKASLGVQGGVLVEPWQFSLVIDHISGNGDGSLGGGKVGIFIDNKTIAEFVPCEIMPELGTPTANVTQTDHEPPPIDAPAVVDESNEYAWEDIALSVFDFMGDPGQGSDGIKDWKAYNFRDWLFGANDAVARALRKAMNKKEGYDSQRAHWDQEAKLYESQMALLLDLVNDALSNPALFVGNRDIRKMMTKDWRIPEAVDGTPDSLMMLNRLIVGNALADHLRLLIGRGQLWILDPDFLLEPVRKTHLYAYVCSKPRRVLSWTLFLPLLPLLAWSYRQIKRCRNWNHYGDWPPVEYSGLYAKFLVAAALVVTWSLLAGLSYLGYTHWWLPKYGKGLLISKVSYRDQQLSVDYKLTNIRPDGYRIRIKSPGEDDAEYTPDRVGNLITLQTKLNNGEYDVAVIGLLGDGEAITSNTEPVIVDEVKLPKAFGMRLNADRNEAGFVDGSFWWKSADQSGTDSQNIYVTVESFDSSHRCIERDSSWLEAEMLDESVSRKYECPKVPKSVLRFKGYTSNTEYGNRKCFFKKDYVVTRDQNDKIHVQPVK